MSDCKEIYAALGLQKYSIRTIDASIGYSTEISAKSKSSAWAKFVALYFGALALFPSREDYEINCIAKGHTHYDRPTTQRKLFWEPIVAWLDGQAKASSQIL